jgi:hypothetical protein
LRQKQCGERKEFIHDQFLFRLSPSILQKYFPLRKSAVAPPRDDDKPPLVKVGSWQWRWPWGCPTFDLQFTAR